MKRVFDTPTEAYNNPGFRLERGSFLGKFRDLSYYCTECGYEETCYVNYAGEYLSRCKLCDGFTVHRPSEGVSRD